jgi:hypothetical protein
MAESPSVLCSSVTVVFDSRDLDCRFELPAQEEGERFLLDQIVVRAVKPR